MLLPKESVATFLPLKPIVIDVTIHNLFCVRVQRNATDHLTDGAKDPK